MLLLFCSPVGEEVSRSLLECLIPLGNELLPDVPSEWSNIGSKFGDLLNTAAILAGAGDGSGHLTLSTAVIEWLEKWYVQENQRCLEESYPYGLHICVAAYFYMYPNKLFQFE